MVPSLRKSIKVWYSKAQPLGVLQGLRVYRGWVLGFRASGLGFALSLRRALGFVVERFKGLRFRGS